MAYSDQFDDLLIKINYFEPITRNSHSSSLENKNICYEILLFQYEGNPNGILTDNVELIFDKSINHGIAIQKNDSKKPLTISELFKNDGNKIISTVKGGIKKEQANKSINHNVISAKEKSRTHNKYLFKTDPLNHQETSSEKNPNDNALKKHFFNNPNERNLRSNKFKKDKVYF